MAETMLFGLEPTGPYRRMYVDVPGTLFKRAQGSEPFAENLEKLSSKKLRAVDIETESGLSRLYINSRVIGAKPPSPKYNILKGVADIVTVLHHDAESAERDPHLSVTIGTERMGTSVRYGMRASILWPDIDDEILTETATWYMQDTARKLRYNEGKLIRELVGAEVERQRGVTLQTNPIGSCSLDTDGGQYRARAPRFELGAHNIYNPEQQIICLAGAIAIAHADALVKE